MTQEEITIMNQLRNRRRMLSLNQAFTAENMKITATMLSRLENGEYNGTLPPNFVNAYSEFLTQCENGTIDYKVNRRNSNVRADFNQQYAAQPNSEKTVLQSNSKTESSNDVLNFYAVSMYTALKMIRFAVSVRDNLETLRQLEPSINNLINEIDNAMKSQRERSLSK